MKGAFQLFRVFCFLAVSILDLAAAPNAESNPPLATAPASLTARDIVSRSLAARGGQAAAAKLQSFHCTGTADFAGIGRSAFELFASRPGQQREFFDFSGSRYDFLFDGQSAWETRPGIGPKKLSGPKVDEARDAAAFFAWYDDLRTCRSIAFGGETVFDGARCYELKVVTQSSRTQTHYYNATNFLLAGVSESVTLDDQPVSLTTTFFEYRKFAGFWFPTRIRGRMDASEWLARITALEVNCVDASVFKAPVEPPATPAPATRETPPGLSNAEIKNILEDYIDSDRLGVGLAVGLLDPAGSRVICYGRMSGQSSPEINGDTLFEIGSITKVFTHLLLHDMVARGEMHMDDPVQTYLPSTVRVPTRNGRQITLWELSMHTSGLPRDMSDPHDVHHLYAFLSKCKLHCEPGERFEYSNLGVALLGQAISLKAGQDYETLVRERICRPLKMDSTVITMTPELLARRAAGHAPANRPADYIGLQGLPGAGALFSTVNDMLKLASAKLGMTSVPLTPLVKKAVPGHDGGTYGFSSRLSFDLDSRRALVVLSNVRNDDLIAQLGLLIQNRSARPVATVPLGTNILDHYVGQYRAGEDRLRMVRRVGDRLRLQVLGEPGCELFPVTETNFYNQLFDCRAVFKGADASGFSTELILGDVAKPQWRGSRISGQVLLPSDPPLNDADCPMREGSIQGVWKATVRPWYWPFYVVHVKVRISEPSPGAFRAELDSPELDAWNLPLAVVYEPPAVEVIGFAGEGSFNGTINSDHTKVSGHWKVNGHDLRATFRRDALLAAPNK